MHRCIQIVLLHVECLVACISIGKQVVDSGPECCGLRKKLMHTPWVMHMHTINCINIRAFNMHSTFVLLLRLVEYTEHWVFVLGFPFVFSPDPISLTLLCTKILDSDFISSVSTDISILIQFCNITSDRGRNWIVMSFRVYRIVH